MSDGLRAGDIEALRNKQALEGRPMKSKIINNGNTQTFFEMDKKGKVNITEKLDLGK